MANEAYECRAVLNWIYRDITMENLDKSLDRTLQKFLLNLYTVHENTKRKRWSHNKEVEKIFRTLEKLDSSLKPMIKNNGLANSWNSNWRDPHLLQNQNLLGVFKAWKSLYKSKPQYFQGLPEEFLLDDWDELTLNTLEKLNEFHLSEESLRNRLKALSKSLNDSQAKVLNGQEFDDEKIKEQIKKAEQSLALSLGDKTLGLLNDFKNFCPQEEMLKLLDNEKVACQLLEGESNEELSLKLGQLFTLINDTGALTPSDTNDSLTSEDPQVEIHHLNYPRSTHPKVSICKRSSENIKMIAIHHTSTKREATPFDINQMHLNRSTNDDPWYMMGYNFLVSDTFDGATSSSPKIFEGRPAEIQGAHAGGRLFEPSEEELEIYKERKIICGEVNGESNIQTVAEKIAKDGGIKGNFFAYGIAVIGNYVSPGEEVVAGVTTPTGLIPDYQQFPSPQIIEKVAKLSCMLQKQNPNIKTIVPHSYFKSTTCPGNLKQAIKLIAQRANSYGCQFNIEFIRGDGKYE